MRLIRSSEPTERAFTSPATHQGKAPPSEEGGAPIQLCSVLTPPSSRSIGPRLKEVSNPGDIGDVKLLGNPPSSVTSRHEAKFGHGLGDQLRICIRQFDVESGREDHSENLEFG